MAEPDDKPDDKSDDAPEPDDKPDPPAPDPVAEAVKWKALARKHEAAAKANAKAAERVKELEDAGKTEVERAIAKTAESERRAADAEARALRLEVAAEKGLTPSQAKRLVGATREELEADADELLVTFGAGKGEERRPAPSGRPRERLRGGGEPDEEPDETDPRKLAAQIPRR